MLKITLASEKERKRGRKEGRQGRKEGRRGRAEGKEEGRKGERQAIGQEWHLNLNINHLSTQSYSVKLSCYLQSLNGHLGP